MEKHVTNLEISKRLKELGVKQESFYSWIQVTRDIYGESHPWQLSDERDLYIPRQFEKEKRAEIVSAFLASELPYVVNWCNKCHSFNVRIQELDSKEYARVNCDECSYSYRTKKIKFLVNPDTQCWVWQLSLNKDGYGRFNLDGRIMEAHIVYYKLIIGDVPTGKELDHLCRNRACVNPFHLEAVSHETNSQRGANRKLSDEQIKEIESLKGKMSQREVAEKFGVKHTTVGFIWNARSWKNLLENKLLVSQKGKRVNI